MPDKYKNIRYGSDMRVLIVGGGVSGLTLAALLLQRGFTPTVVEKVPEYGKVGYVIVIWPSGSKILKGLGLYEDLLDKGCEFRSYKVSNYKGEIISTYSIDPVAEKYGPIISIYRPELIDILRKGVDPCVIKMNTVVEKITQNDDSSLVQFSSGETEEYDLVVGCDGIRSRTREQVFGDIPLHYSGMSGWGFWVDPDTADTDEIIEYWGKGKFMGIWPTKGKLSVFTSVKIPRNIPDPESGRIERINKYFGSFGGIVPDILSQLKDPGQIYHDDYHDLRMDKWHKGRVVLAGDSAHAILPNAGAGVSMAMESSAVLAEELCRTDSKYIKHALAQYEERRRSRVDKVQNQSRMMGKIVYANSKLFSTVRDYIMKLYSRDLLIRYWDGMLKEPI